LPKAIEAFKQAKEFGELIEAERRTSKVDQELVDVCNSVPH